MEKKINIPGADINKNVLLQKYRIDPTVEIMEPPVYCKIDDKPSMTAGNFSLINGKAKSGKTFLLGAMVGSMTNNSAQLRIIQGCLPSDKNVILYFDTEQSTFHAARTIKRICKLIDNPDPCNLIAYGLRPLTPSERLTAIEDAISSTENLGAVAIDGIRDLLTMGINDEAEATSLTSKFLKWTSDFDIHIILLLHQNKTDLNARGHIGTEILNKAETVLSVCKEAKTNTFVVSCEYSRDIAFDDFGFIIDNGEILPSNLSQDENTKNKNPKLMDDQKHQEILSSIFKNNTKLSYMELQDEIIYRMDNTFGRNSCRPFITHYEKNGWIVKQRDGHKVFYTYTRAIF